MAWGFWAVTLLLYRYADTQRILDEHWLDETEAVVAIAKRFRVHLGRRHPDRYTENQSAVCHSLAKRLSLAPFRVHVMRIEIASLASVDYDVRFCDGSAECLSHGTDFVLLKLSRNDHS